MKEKIKTLYYPQETFFEIIEFNDGRRIALTNKRKSDFQDKYCEKLEDIKRARISVKRKKTIGFDFDEIIDIVEKDNEYVLFIVSSRKEYKISITSHELKVILCEKLV